MTTKTQQAMKAVMKEEARKPNRKRAAMKHENIKKEKERKNIEWHLVSMKWIDAGEQYFKWMIKHGTEAEVIHARDQIKDLKPYRAELVELLDSIIKKTEHLTAEEIQEIRGKYDQ